MTTRPVPDDGRDMFAADAGDVIEAAAHLGPDTAESAGIAYRELAGILFAERPLGAILSRVCELTRGALPAADDVSITLILSGSARSVAFAGDSRLAFTLDERQYADDYGPCMHAASSGSSILINDLAESRIYPEFAKAALRQGITHTLAVGLPIQDDVSGALNIYGHRDNGPFTDEMRIVAEGFAGYAGAAVTNAALYTYAVEETAQMREAMRSRAVIEQAKGIIMHSERCDPERAFDILRQASMKSNRKLRDVAQALVAKASSGE